MPARTVPDTVHDVPRIQSRNYALVSDHPDAGDTARLQRTHVPYDMSFRPPPMIRDNNHSPYPRFDNQYPTSYIPLQTFPPPHPHPPPPFVSYPGSSSILLHNDAHPHPPIVQPTWRPLPPMHRLPPPPIPHRVWILDCKSCDMFLTNRGMKAVLLLRPNVPLYSTDAMPINCSASSDTYDAPTSSPVTPLSSTSSNSSGSSPTAAERPRIIARTCECLTQTLHCHGCGNSVGYMIVSPCHRCMSSITANHRSTNGHRFVFYSNEIVASQRYYIDGESGIRTYAMLGSPPLSMNHPPPPPIIPPPPGAHYMPLSRIVPHPLEIMPGITQEEPSPGARLNSASTESQSPMSSVQFAPNSANDQRSPRAEHGTSPYDISLRIPPVPYLASTYSGYEESISSSSEGSSSPASSTNSSLGLYRFPGPLQPGDVVFWHHLVHNGETPAIIEDPRARKPRDTSEEYKQGYKDAEKPVPRTVSARSRGVVAGR
ncbi:hypothetical protein BXZ70DRAFT_911215 [Cristinia sonorae]|uniref:Uncharacterized protein n=1 Tax=Cristinia sonorae TaxID=1940300 RepID=A0A8K0XJZ7_9AGAR|nr:hypothetical protein BXZ70DRAFT_911215 [Cristinia sonorae]